MGNAFGVINLRKMKMNDSSKPSTPKRKIKKAKYGQKIPWRFPSALPPNLPPILLENILMKDTAPSCEPTLLHEPNNGMINHLYKTEEIDGVIMIAKTHRFRKKCVTTILCKSAPKKTTRNRNYF
ncbi:5'-AMP-activated protein kinase subunit beta-1-like [Trichogramma pretiosum]|uniref:5'-AMP-activated protein kinase subunit beta-1-like n=1 Tax=Trichogramma pretiosum TaxID=7493 RepID=UPI0006C9B1C0|nr:5'-AMP-activated protein kinase subunit beta-1-like [Trichogramma pretiosum]